MEDALEGWDADQLFGEADEKPRWEMTDDEKQAQVEQTARGAQSLIERVQDALHKTPDTEHPQLRRTLTHLEKSLRDAGMPPGEDAPQRRPKGTYTIGSATDPEATVRNHGKKDGEKDLILGYNVQVAATVDGLITETAAQTGAKPDQAGIADLIVQQKAHHGVVPPKMIYDAAAGSGKTRHDVAEASGGQTRLSAPLPDYAGRSERFGPYDFTLSEDGERLTCPAGKQTEITYRSGSGEGRIFRFHWFHCWEGKPAGWWKHADLSQRCPLWEQCRGAQQGPRSMRQVFISDYRAEVEAAAAYNQTEDYRADRKKRPRIERVIAELTRYNDARRCRKRGLRSADWQAKLALSLSKGWRRWPTTSSGGCGGWGMPKPCRRRDPGWSLSGG
jgi:hypothetical protein